MKRFLVILAITSICIPGIAFGQQDVTVTFTLNSPAISISASPTSWGIGNIDIGSTKTSSPIEVTNNGLAPVQLSLKVAGYDCSTDPGLNMASLRGLFVTTLPAGYNTPPDSWFEAGDAILETTTGMPASGDTFGVDGTETNAPTGGENTGEQLDLGAKCNLYLYFMAPTSVSAGQTGTVQTITLTIGGSSL